MPQYVHPSSSQSNLLRRTSVISILIALIASFSSTWGCSSAAPKPQMLAPVTPSASPVLLFTGTGTTASDVAAVKAVLDKLRLAYVTVDTTHLNAMSEPQLAAYKLLIVPGGNSIDIGQNLSANETTAIRNAVQQYGLHYRGICAGAFFGAASDYNGVNLTSGVSFNFYADEFRGIHREPVAIRRADGNVLDVYWEDGPQLSGWGNVVATFPDGTAAITEGNVGNGFVVFTGVHLEAPAGWRAGMAFNTPLETDLAYAATVIQAALTGNALPHF